MLLHQPGRDRYYLEERCEKTAVYLRRPTMIAFHGTSLYGKVDRVKGLFHVATLFFHVDWIPIIPRKSYLILEGGGKRSYTAIPIRLSAKSVLFAWGRLLALVGGCFVLPVACIISASEIRGAAGQSLAATALLSPLVALALFVLSYRFGQASPERALELAQLAGVEPETLARFFAERMTAEDEDRLRNLAAEQVDSGPSSP